MCVCAVSTILSCFGKRYRPKTKDIRLLTMFFFVLDRHQILIFVRFKLNSLQCSNFLNQKVARTRTWFAILVKNKHRSHLFIVQMIRIRYPSGKSNEISSNHFKISQRTSAVCPLFSLYALGISSISPHLIRESETKSASMHHSQTNTICKHTACGLPALLYLILRLN